MQQACLWACKYEGQDVKLTRQMTHTENQTNTAQESFIFTSYTMTDTCDHERHGDKVTVIPHPSCIEMWSWCRLFYLLKLQIAAHEILLEFFQHIFGIFQLLSFGRYLFVDRGPLFWGEFFRHLLPFSSSARRLILQSS